MFVNVLTVFYVGLNYSRNCKEALPESCCILAATKILAVDQGQLYTVVILPKYDPYSIRIIGIVTAVILRNVQENT